MPVSQPVGRPWQGQIPAKHGKWRAVTRGVLDGYRNFEWRPVRTRPGVYTGRIFLPTYQQWAPVTSALVRWTVHARNAAPNPLMRHYRASDLTKIPAQRAGAVRRLQTLQAKGPQGARLTADQFAFLTAEWQRHIDLYTKWLATMTAAKNDHDIYFAYDNWRHVIGADDYASQCVSGLAHANDWSRRMATAEPLYRADGPAMLARKAQHEVEGNFELAGMVQNLYDQWAGPTTAARASLQQVIADMTPACVGPQSYPTQGALGNRVTGKPRSPCS